MMKLNVSMLLLLTVSTVAFSQNLKIGYTNVEYVLSVMPETEQVESEFKSYQTQYQNQLRAKYEEYQSKVAEYQQNAPNMLDAIRQDKEDEIRSLEQSIQKFEQNIQAKLAEKQEELLGPLYEKITKAINVVAEANGYTHVFSNDAGGMPVLLYAREEDNITVLVMDELGIEAPAPEE